VSALRPVAVAPVLVRLAAGACAVVLGAVPILTAPVRPVTAVAVLGMGLAGLGVALLWRWAATAAACVFAIGYALALWIEAPPPGLAVPATFGVALVFWLQAVDLGFRTRGAAVDAGVFWSRIAGWLGFGATTAGVVLLVHVLAADVAPVLPLGAAPVLAAAGALGVLGAVVLAFRRIARPRSRPGP
jgi:hypothetical protein